VEPSFERIKVLNPRCRAPWFHGGPESPRPDAGSRRDEGEARADY